MKAFSVITLLLVFSFATAATSSSSSRIRGNHHHAADEVNQLVTSRTREVASSASLFQHQQQRDLQLDICGGVDTDTERVATIGNVQCSCDFASQDGKVDFTLSCETTQDECLPNGNYCGTVSATCTMSADINAFELTTFACTSCLQFTTTTGVLQERGVEEMCMTLDVNTQFDLDQSDVTDVLNSCAVSVNGEDCECGWCENVFLGLAIDCTNTDLNMKTECTELGDVDPNNPVALAVKTTTFMPEFVAVEDEEILPVEGGTSSSSAAGHFVFGPMTAAAAAVAIFGVSLLVV